MDEEMTATETAPRSITVKIFGGEYRLKGPEDPQYVHAVARLVDERMREVADHQGVTSPSRAAILASLNLADELLRERGQRERLATLVDERSRELSRRVRAMVGEGA